MMTKASLVLPVVLAALASACAAPLEPTPVQPRPPVSTAPASIQVLAASRSDQRVNLTALVRTVDGKPVADVSVTFSASSGTLNPEVATTNASGEAVVILAPASSQTMVRAQTDGLSSSLNVMASPALPPPTPAPAPTPPPSQPEIPLTVSINVSPGPAGSPTAFSLSTQAITSASWTFGDGATATTTTGNTSHVYATPGPYTVSVTVQDGRGRTASSAITITIGNPPSQPPPPPLTVTLTCTEAPKHGTPFPCNVTAIDQDGTIRTSQISNVRWDWGDGTIPTASPGPLFSYKYDQAGTYLVFVTVTANGIVGTTSKALIVS